jgi:CRP/FNR family transcriptional regulator, cyclic AMP receptor protein
LEIDGQNAVVHTPKIRRCYLELMSEQVSDKRGNFEKTVAAHPFLLGMNELHVRLLADCAIHSHFHSDGIIFREGEPANRFYLILRGKVRLESSTLGKLIPIDEIHNDDLLGWSWLFPPYAWHFTARALEETDAIFFYGTILREYCEKDHSLGFELFKRMSAVMLRRLQAARQKLMAAGRS